MGKKSEDGKEEERDKWEGKNGAKFKEKRDVWSEEGWDGES